MRVILLFFFVGVVAHIDAGAQQRPYVILISFDGLRHDQPELFSAPNILAFREKGSYATGLIPCFPSKTFPNHYSLVTGLYPGKHGLVDNSFYDPLKGEHYSMKSRRALVDPYYYGGIPLWKLAMQHGVKSASFFWVGSEIAKKGYHPDYYFPYDESVPFPTRVEQVLAWLDLPEEERPHLITLYFSSPDHEAHEYGPLSDETKQAVLRVDSLLGNLMGGIAERDIPVNVILVSDHGMTEVEVNEDSFIYVEDIAPMDNAVVTLVNAGSQVHCYVRDKRKIDSVYQSLKNIVQHADVLKEEEFPAQWHYAHRRSGDILIVAHPQFYFKDRRPEIQPAAGKKIGVHGYDPDSVPEMMGIFYAQGPQIKPGKVLPPFRNIHVYPLIARILDLPLPDIDGDPRVLKPIYKKSSGSP